MGATPDYVEAVCQFRGKQGKLYAALLAPLVPNGVGFIEEHTSSGEEHTSSVEIHDWHDTNGQMVVSWKNGCKGGRKRTRGLPTDSPTDNPPRADQSRVEKSREDQSREEDHTPSKPAFPPPSWEQVLEYAKAVSLPYSEEDIRRVYLSFCAVARPDGTWERGKKLVVDWRAALEERLGLDSIPVGEKIPPPARPVTTLEVMLPIYQWQMSPAFTGLRDRELEAEEAAAVARKTEVAA